MYDTFGSFDYNCVMVDGCESWINYDSIFKVIGSVKDNRFKVWSLGSIIIPQSVELPGVRITDEGLEHEDFPIHERRDNPSEYGINNILYSLYFTGNYGVRIA